MHQDERSSDTVLVGCPGYSERVNHRHRRRGSSETKREGLRIAQPVTEDQRQEEQEAVCAAGSTHVDTRTKSSRPSALSGHNVGVLRAVGKQRRLSWLVLDRNKTHMVQTCQSKTVSLITFQLTLPPSAVPRSASSLLVTTRTSSGVRNLFLGDSGKSTMMNRAIMARPTVMAPSTMKIHFQPSSSGLEAICVKP